jgi:hypothetical protein
MGMTLGILVERRTLADGPWETVSGRRSAWTPAVWASSARVGYDGVPSLYTGSTERDGGTTAWRLERRADLYSTSRRRGVTCGCFGGMQTRR